MNPPLESVAAVPTETGELLVAFASSDGDLVDEHFGSAAAFYLYRVGTAQSAFIAEQRFGQEKKDGNEDKLRPKLAWLAGCDLVYCGSIGGSATRQLLALEITPMQVAEGPEIAELVADLQRQLAGAPERWLDNILRRKARRGAAMPLDADEEWTE